MSNQLWKRVKELTITQFLRINKDALLKVTGSDGTVSSITADEFSSLDAAFRAETVITTKTLTAADSGKTLYLDLAGGFTTTLPAPAAGLKYKFVVKTAPTTAYILVTNGSANIMIGGINELEVDTADDGPYIANGDTLNFVASTAVVGDYVDMESDGTSWYFHGQAKADGGISLAST